jgi:hypothetical protein
MAVKRTSLRDITLCSPLKVGRRFGGTYHLHLHGQRISWARNQHESRWQAVLVSCSSYIPEDSTHCFFLYENSNGLDKHCRDLHTVRPSVYNMCLLVIIGLNMTDSLSWKLLKRMFVCISVDIVTSCICYLPLWIIEDLHQCYLII